MSNEEIKEEVGPDQTDINDRDSELHSIIYGGEYSEYGEDLAPEEEEHQVSRKKLKTFEKTEEKPEKKLKTMTQKRITLIAVISAAVVAAVVLILIFAPDIFADPNVEEPVKLYEGEVLNGKRRVLIYEQIERARIQRIEVKNEYGKYTVYYNNETESFCFEGMEGAPYDEDLFAQLVVAAGYTLISDRFLPGDDRADLSEYGLGKEDDPSYFIITTRPDDDGKQVSYKLYIGKPSLTEDYYYCMLEGRDIVYVLERSIKNTLLADVKSLLTPIITYPISDNSYLTQISDVQIAEKGEWIKIKCLNDEEKAAYESDFGVTVPYVMYEPLEYDASSTQMTTVLGQIVNMTGSELLEYNIYDVVKLYNEDGTPVLDEDGEQDYDYVMKKEYEEKYGLGTPAYMIYYVYNGMDIVVYLSEKQYGDDGSAFYYAASLLFDTIVKMDAEKLTFLDWSLVDYLDKPVFSVQIDKVSSIKISTADKNFLFTLTGIGDDLVCVESAYTARTVFKGENTTATSNDGIRNFRKFYQTILSINREDFVEEPAEDERALLCEMEVTFRNGKVRTYKFYSYSERRCFMTIDDKGEFYVLRSMIKKLVDDAVRLMNHETVDPGAEY